MNKNKKENTIIIIFLLNMFLPPIILKLLWNTEILALLWFIGSSAIPLLFMLLTHTNSSNEAKPTEKSK